jgi:hypothetical protein
MIRFVCKFCRFVLLEISAGSPVHSSLPGRCARCGRKLRLVDVDEIVVRGS